jgi:bifunctional DNase/RNase
MIPVQVKEIAFDTSLTPVVLLLDESEQRVLPVWVGPFEAQAIAMAMQGLLPPRPMTHDLIKSIYENLGVLLRRVIINDIREGTYYAEIQFQTDTGEVNVDSRPSDAIALALKAGAPVFISEKVANYTLEASQLMDEEQQSEMRRVLSISGPEEYKKMLH